MPKPIPEKPQRSQPDGTPRGHARRARLVLRRVVQFALIAVVIPLLLLGVAEIALRALGYGYSTRFFVKKRFDGERYYVTNKDFYQQYYALPIDELWEDAATFLEADKPANHYRIVVLGGSAALGVPPDFAFSFGRVLEVMLRTRFPDTHFDLYMFAQPGVNSYTMREAARACKAIQPDLFIVYMGNNEVNGPYGATTTAESRLPMGLPLVRARTHVTNLRLAQLVAGGGRVAWHPPTGKGDPHIPLDAPAIQRTYAHFSSNLDDICTAARRAGARVLLCTVGCNLRDWAPMISMNRNDLSASELGAWQEAYAQGVAAEERGEWSDALDAYESAFALDATHAELRFRMGRCCLELGEEEAARDHFYWARDLDGFRARVLGRVNEITTACAQGTAAQGIDLVDTAGELAAHSPHALPGHDFFYDNVHLTFEGNYLIGRLIFEHAAGLLPEWVTRQAPGPIEPLSKAACEVRLGMTPGVRLKHLRGVRMGFEMWWDAHPDRLNQRIEELEHEIGPDLWPGIADGYRRALEFAPSDRILLIRYAEALLEMGELEQALEQARILAEKFPFRAAAHRFLCDILTKLGRFDEALAALDTALTLLPEDSRTLFVRGSLLDHAGRAPEAVEAYTDAILIYPRNWEAYDPLDALYRAHRDIEGRIDGWRDIVTKRPDAGRAHFHLAMALDNAERLDEAIEHYEEACRLEQFDPAMQGALGQALVKTGDFASAIMPLQRSLEINPDNDYLRPILIRCLVEQDRYEEAGKERAVCLEKGVELPPELEERLSAGLAAPSEGPTGPGQGPESGAPASP